jgi:hypothetical protein
VADFNWMISGKKPRWGRGRCLLAMTEGCQQEDAGRMGKRAGWLVVSKKLPTKVSSKSGRNPNSVPRTSGRTVLLEKPVFELTLSDSRFKDSSTFKILTNLLHQFDALVVIHKLFLRSNFFEEDSTPRKTPTFGVVTPADERIEVFRGNAREQVGEASGGDGLVASFLAAWVEAREDLVVQIAALCVVSLFRWLRVLAEQVTDLVHHTRRRRLISCK